jgi:hypothetical protein
VPEQDGQRRPERPLPVPSQASTSDYTATVEGTAATAEPRGHRPWVSRLRRAGGMRIGRVIGGTAAKLEP